MCSRRFGGHRPTGGPPVLAGCQTQTQPDVAGAGPSESSVVGMAVLNLLLVELRAASLYSGGTQMCPRNYEAFLSALSAHEVEIVLSKTDEQDALTSWHLRFWFGESSVCRCR